MTHPAETYLGSRSMRVLLGNSAILARARVSALDSLLDNLTYSCGRRKISADALDLILSSEMAKA